MCGIVAYLGSKQAAPVLIDGLKKLEYRGYDSAGIAVFDGELHLFKRKGSVARLEEAKTLPGKAGIGHTRWATHGAPSERNAHPHVYGRFAIVHNGIIENHLALKRECPEQFSSDTDSEVVAHLLEHAYEGDLLAAVRGVAARLEGSFALAVLCTDCPDEVVLARRASPLIVGMGEDGAYAASDLPAIAAKGRTLYSLEDGQFARLTEEKAEFFDEEGKKITLNPLVFDALEGETGKGGYRHFMCKEMAEIPQILQKLASKIDFSPICEVLCQTEYIQILACGTAYHAGLCAENAIERLARVPTRTYIASEYRYGAPIVKKGTLAIAISQSGETADTLAAARLAKKSGAYLIAVTNTRYSSLTSLADACIETEAGREVAVAATKSFNAQIYVLFRLAVFLARIKGRRADDDPLNFAAWEARKAARACEGVKRWTPHFAAAKSVFFVGRGADRCVALEGSLKLKEISYLPGEGYAAGELKHGTLALIEKGTPVVAIVTDETLAEKTMNAVHETYARGANVFLVTSLPALCTCKEVKSSVVVPDCGPVFSPLLSVMPLQALAYHVAVSRAIDPDKPRNLAKSVTVE